MALAENLKLELDPQNACGLVMPAAGWRNLDKWRFLIYIKKKSVNTAFIPQCQGQVQVRQSTLLTLEHHVHLAGGCSCTCQRCSVLLPFPMRVGFGEAFLGDHSPTMCHYCQSLCICVGASRHCQQSFASEEAPTVSESSVKVEGLTSKRSLKCKNL